MSVSFGPEVNVYTGGGRGAVAVNSSGTIVVVMLTTTSLVYSVGSVDLSTNTVSFPSSAPSTAYAWGNDMPAINFDVAIQDTGNQVVLVWQTGGGDNKLFYRTGTLSGGSISWNPVVQFDKGIFPSVSVAGNTVVEIHASQNNEQKIYYHLGSLNGSNITNFDQGGTEFAKFWQSVVSTSCVITTNSWFVATITGGQGAGLSVFSYSGSTFGGKLNYLGDGSVASGNDSNLMLINWGTLLELHDLNSDDIHQGTIYLSQGTLDENSGSDYGKLSWEANTTTGVAGAYPDIAASGAGAAGSYIVMTYMSTDGTFSTKARLVTLS